MSSLSSCVLRYTRIVVNSLVLLTFSSTSHLVNNDVVPMPVKFVHSVQLQP